MNANQPLRFTPAVEGPFSSELQKWAGILSGPLEVLHDVTPILDPKGIPMKAATALAAIFNLLPVIAAGYSQIHADKDLNSKTVLAQDALAIAVAGAASVVSDPEEQKTVLSVGQTAATTLNALLAAFHKPAPATT